MNISNSRIEQENILEARSVRITCFTVFQWNVVCPKVCNSVSQKDRKLLSASLRGHLLTESLLEMRLSLPAYARYQSGHLDSGPRHSHLGWGIGRQFRGAGYRPTQSHGLWIWKIPAHTNHPTSLVIST